MHEFMDDNIIDDGQRDPNETPIEGHESICVTEAPMGFVLGDFSSRWLRSHHRSIVCDPFRE